MKNISLAQIAGIYKKYGTKLNSSIESLDQALQKKFNKVFTEEEINGTSYQIVVVASALDPSTERIVKYLSDYEIPINTLFFHVFADGKNRYISRAWLIDPVVIGYDRQLPS